MNQKPPIVTLYKRTQTRILSWVATISNSSVVIEHGEYRGKSQVDIIKCPTLDQAYTELNRRVSIKTTKQGYTDHIPDEVPNLPMLATEYDPSKLPELVYVQPKLDGIRCVASCKGLHTRRGEPITSMPHILKLIKFLQLDPPGMVLDGELYCHGESFQEHLSLIKRDTPHTNHEQVQYRIFDLIDEQLTFDARHKQLLFYFPPNNTFEKISYVRTELISLQSVPQYAKQHYSDYEGVILRNPKGMYRKNHRSSDLQKYKWTDSVECQILGVTAPTSGRAEGCAIFICQHPVTLQHFKVVPKESMYIRKWLYENKSDIINYWTRVTYEKLSDKGVPLKPRAEGYKPHKKDLQ